LNGFTIKNAYASPSSGLNGAGISISNASPTISNNNVTNNTGCGIFVFNLASPLIEGDDIKQNGGPNPDVASPCNVPRGAGTNNDGEHVE
jgi:parallel beta-helix repeat protein